MVDFSMHKYKRMGIWFSMLAAFLTGILFMNLAGDTYLGKSMVSLQKIMYSGREEMTGKTGYLYYLLKIRGKEYLFLGLLGQAFGGMAWIILFGNWFCLTEGILLTSGFIQQQMSGSWILVLAQMPHMILYGLVYTMLLRSYMVQENEKRTIFFRSWLMNVPVILLGILTEYYVNPWCLKWLYHMIK